MKYLSLFSGIGTAEKGIEQAYENVHNKRPRPELFAERIGDSGMLAGRESGQSAISRNNSRNGTRGGRQMPECIGFAEIDRFAASIYKYHWPDVKNYGDATTIIPGQLPEIDFLVGGFPCQSFSIAGQRQGFNEARGTLFFEIARILSHCRPRHFLLENVKGLLSSDDGKVYTTILRILSDLDYRVETVVLNSKHYGVPQNRERVFFIGHLGNECSGEILSFGNGDGEFDEEYGDAAYCLDANYAKGCNDLNKARRTVVNGSGSVTNEIMQLNDPTHSNNRVYAQGGSRQPFVALTERRTDEAKQIRRESQQQGRDFSPRRGKEIVARCDDLANTVTATPSIEMMVQAVDTKNVGDARFTDNVAALGANDFKEPKGVMLSDRRIRRLTPVECCRLQGLPDDWCDYGIDAKGNVYEISDSQKYKTLGNAMTVNVIEAIVTRMISKGCL